MKKEILTHYLFAVAFGLFVSIFRGYLELSYWPFWVGITIGTILPNIDYLIYAYFLRPQEFMSQRTMYLAGEKRFGKIADIWSQSSRDATTKLIFHTYYFQIIFMFLTFWVVTSSSSFLGIGLTLAFSLHLLVDELTDFMKKGTIASWFREAPISMSAKQEKVYLLANLLALILIGFFL